MVTWFSSSNVHEAFLVGLKSNDNDMNPYEYKTNEWYSWNRGYNQKITNELAE